MCGRSSPSKNGRPLRKDGSGRNSVPLTHDERVAIARSKAEAARGEFASDEDVRAVWAKYGL